MSAFITGVALSLLASLFKAGKSITTKLAVGGTDEYATAWGGRFVAAVCLGTVLFLTGGVELPMERMFWLALGITSIGFAASTVLLAKAYKVSDVSLIAPLIGFVPIATSIPAWVLLNETPTVLAGLGILLVTVGAYTLQLHEHENGYLEPLRALARDQGAKYVAAFLLIVAVIPSVEKLGLRHVSPLLWTFSTMSLMAIILSGILAHRRHEPGTVAIREEWPVLVLLGVFSGGLLLAQSYAYTMLNVAYVQAIKRASLLPVIGAGWVMFDEAHIRQRLLGGGIILIGISLIIIFG